MTESIQVDYLDLTLPCPLCDQYPFYIHVSEDDNDEFVGRDVCKFCGQEVVLKLDLKATLIK